MNLKTHIIHNPAGTFSFVGSLPVVLGQIVPATKSDILGGRAHRDEAGALVTYKFPCFATRTEAVAFAQSCNVEIA